MTRQERLEYCKICNNKSFSPNRGIICAITDNVATFEHTCQSFLLDEKIKSLQEYQKRQGTYIDKVVEKRIPEKITSDDMYLLTGFALINTFCLQIARLMDIARSGNWHIALLVLTFASLALLLRKKEKRHYAILGDMKFKTIYSIILTLINYIYLLLVSHSHQNIIGMTIWLLIVSFILSVISVLLVKPINFVYNSILRLYETK